MTTLNFKPLAKTIKFDDSMMWVELSDGRTLGTPLVYFPRLLNASKQQRECYEISGGGIGLHWEELDEDIHVGYLLMGGFDVSQNSVLNTKSEQSVY